MNPEISIVLCTYNRAKLLEKALQSLSQQILSFEKYEIIIIDNNSSDNTPEISQRYVRNHSNIHYFVEKNVGLSFARNRGWRESKGKFVGFIDDDSKASPEWLEIAYQIIQELSPNIFGGPYYPYFEINPPKWFPENFGFGGKKVSEPCFLLKDEYLSGTNMFFKRDILEELDGFNTDFGMSGKKCGYGEETDLFMRASEKIKDLEIYYHPKMLVYHLVDKNKMSLKWWIKHHYAKGKYHLNLNSTNNHKTDSRFHLSFQLMKLAVVIFLKIVKGVFFRDRKKYFYYKTYLTQDVFKQFRNIARLLDHNA